MGSKPRVSDKQLEEWRETGIRLDRRGRFWHEGREITHKRLRLALLSWLSRRDDGKAILQLDAKRYAYIDVEDSDLLVVSLGWPHDRPIILLNDGNTEELRLESLRSGEHEALYCNVRNGKLTARFTTQAQQLIAPHIEEHDEQPMLKVGDQLYPILTATFG